MPRETEVGYLPCCLGTNEKERLSLMVRYGIVGAHADLGHVAIGD